MLAESPAAVPAALDTEPRAPLPKDLYDSWADYEEPTVRVMYQTCDSCGGYGRVFFEREAGATEEGRCPSCCGFGEMLVEVRP